MTIAAYTTGNVTAETMANALVVMEAYRASGDKLDQEFSNHPKIDVTGTTTEGGMSFTADLSGLSRAVSMTVNNGPAIDIAVSQPIEPQAKEALSAAPKPAQSANKAKPKPAPKR